MWKIYMWLAKQWPEMIIKLTNAKVVTFKYEQTIRKAKGQENGDKTVLSVFFDLAWKVKYSTTLIFKVIFLSKIGRIFMIFSPWRIQKLKINFYYLHIMITLIFYVLYVLWHLIPNQTKWLGHLYVHFHRPWAIHY